MTSPLFKDALQRVWSDPNYLNHIVFKLPRITANGGQSLQLQIGWLSYSLPSKTSFFHVYQVGQIPPTLLSLMEASDTWKTCSSAIIDTGVILDMYTSKGIMLPKTRTWYRYTANKNLLFAVEFNSNMQYDFNEQIFLRIYSNAYYNVNPTPKPQVYGGRMTSIQDITTLQSQVAAVNTTKTYCHINGYRQPAINATTVVVGDIAEMVYDPSIYKVVELPLSGLSSFFSTLDSKNKYLLHYSGSNDGYIDSVDEIDLYLIDSNAKGVYIHRNAADTLRSLTNKDYSLVSSYLDGYKSNFAPNATLSVRLCIKQSGYLNTPIVDNNNTPYIQNLSDTQQVQAMVGVNSTLDLWTADKLESSGYARLLSAYKYNDITQTLVESAYGYTAANYYLGTNPVVLSSGSCSIPVAYQNSSTAFEFDVNGVLLGYYSVPSGSIVYNRTNSNAVLVEFIEGVGSSTLDEVVGMTPITMSTLAEYRFYQRITTPPNTPIWTDVTGSNYYSIAGAVATWNPNNLLLNTDYYVRSNKNFLLYQTTINVVDGLFTHTLPLTVPMGELDLWINGNALVPGIDYIYKFPQITIVSKKWIGTQPSSFTLTVRATGFCSPDLSPRAKTEVGFVFGGYLSANGKYDLHKNRVSHIVVGGAVVHPNTVKFLEGPVGSATPLDGTPYCVHDIVNGLAGLINQDAHNWYLSTIADEKKVASYLNLKLPEVLPVPLNPITQKYALFSPFLGKLIYDLRNSIIVDPNLAGAYSDEYVRGVCSPYEYLLVSDPINPANTPDMNYCEIHPHCGLTALSLSADQYRFINNVTRIYANGLVNLNSLLYIL